MSKHFDGAGAERAASLGPLIAHVAQSKYKPKSVKITWETINTGTQIRPDLQLVPVVNIHFSEKGLLDD